MSLQYSGISFWKTIESPRLLFSARRHLRLLFAHRSDSALAFHIQDSKDTTTYVTRPNSLSLATIPDAAN